MPGRSASIQYAARADSEESALSFQEVAELLADYHRSVAPVILLPIDRALCTERTSGIATSLGRTLPKPQPVRKMTGDASDRARAGLQQLGITLLEHAGQRLQLLD
jgi:hypothetical protein